jgi:hypothetical protein
MIEAKTALVLFLMLVSKWGDVLAVGVFGLVEQTFLYFFCIVDLHWIKAMLSSRSKLI